MFNVLSRNILHNQGMEAESRHGKNVGGKGGDGEVARFPIVEDSEDGWLRGHLESRLYAVPEVVEVGVLHCIPVLKKRPSREGGQGRAALTCSLLTVKLVLGWVVGGAGAGALAPPSLEEAEGARGSPDAPPSLRGEEEGGGGGAVSGGAPARGTPVWPTLSM